MSNQLWRESTGRVSAASHFRVPVQIHILWRLLLTDCSSCIIGTMGRAEGQEHMLVWHSIDTPNRLFKTRRQVLQNLWWDLHTTVLLPETLFKVYWEISVWCRYPTNLNRRLAVTEKCAGFKEMRVEIQYFCFGKDDVSLHPELNTRLHSTSQVPGAI